MDNVVEFASYTKPLTEEEEVQIAVQLEDDDPIGVFIHDFLLPWAEEYGINTSTDRFKIQGATIMTCLQGILLDNDL